MYTYDELDDVEGGPACLERCDGEVKTAAERRQTRLPALGRQRARDVPGAAVQRDRPTHGLPIQEMLRGTAPLLSNESVTRHVC